MRKMSASRGPNAEETENFLILNSDDEDVEVIADLEGEQEDDLDEDEDAEGGEEDDDEGKTFSTDTSEAIFCYLDLFAAVLCHRHNCMTFCLKLCSH